MVQRIPDTTSTPIARQQEEAVRPSQTILPAGYTLTDTTSWQTDEEEGQRAVLRRGGVAIDTVDLDFGVAVVGEDSLVFLPVRTDSLDLHRSSVPTYDSYPTEHTFWTLTSRRRLRDFLPFFSGFFSSPTVPQGAVIHYWGIAPNTSTNRLYAMRYDFRAARLDSVFLNREDPLATDYRYHLVTPQVHGSEVAFAHTIVDATTWRVIRQDSVSH